MTIKVVQGVLRSATPAYTAQGVNFNGTAYLSKASALTGVADGKSFILSTWFKNTGGAGSYRVILSLEADAGHFGIQIYIAGSNNKFSIVASADGTTSTVQFASSSTYTSMATWKHLLISFDAATNVQWLYVNDASDLGTVTSNVNSTLGFSTFGGLPKVGNDIGGDIWTGDDAWACSCDGAMFEYADPCLLDEP